MREQQRQQPVRLVIFGTDAAGKNFVGELIQRRLYQAGLPVALREQWLSAKDQSPESLMAARDTVEPGERKSRLSQWAESAFISAYPLMRWAMLPVADYMIRFDLFKYRYRANNVILVSHTAIRLLAFELGHRVKQAEDVVLPPRLTRLLDRMATVFNASAVVLDIEHAVREARVAQREAENDSDAFDRYLAKHPELSERIEAIMVKIAQEHFGARVIENNDLPESLIMQAVCEHSSVVAEVLAGAELANPESESVSPEGESEQRAVALSQADSVAPAVPHS